MRKRSPTWGWVPIPGMAPPALGASSRSEGVYVESPCSQHEGWNQACFSCLFTHPQPHARLKVNRQERETERKGEGKWFPFT